MTTIDLIALRSRSGLSQREFAERHGINFHTLRGWEGGRPIPYFAAKFLEQLDSLTKNERE